IIAEVAAVNRTFGFVSDIVPEANKQILTPTELEEVEKAVISFVENHPDNSNITTAFFALGKFRDKALEPFFQKWLAYYSKRGTKSAKALGKILVSMKDTGFKTITGNSWSFDDYKKNF